MAMVTLKNPSPVVERGGQRTSGGSQRWLKSETAQKYGCGLVAATDLLLYLHRYGEGTSDFFRGIPEGPIPWEVYDYCADRLRKRYLPLLPPFGLNAWVLAGGLNRYFREYRLPCRARWGVPPGRLWQAMESMLVRDIPVILCIGVNFPFPRHKLGLYQGEGHCEAGATRAHYVTVTGLDKDWMRISSWGQIYDIRREEFDRYRRWHSCGFYTNLVWIKRTPSPAAAQRSQAHPPRRSAPKGCAGA